MSRIFTLCSEPGTPKLQHCTKVLDKPCQRLDDLIDLGHVLGKQKTYPTDIQPFTRPIADL
jgi:hypothetical protein